MVIAANLPTREGWTGGPHLPLDLNPGLFDSRCGEVSVAQISSFRPHRQVGVTGLL